MVGGANDYRTVDRPGLVDGEETGDAWLGLFKSFDGGRTWKSTLLPGCPEAIPQCDGAPAIKGMQAGADPTVRAGTNGLFYYSGLAFNRGDGAPSAVFVSRLIDNNNKENGDPIAFLGTSVVQSGNAAITLDKPSLAVDVPREDAHVCPINSGNTVQMIRAGTVYVAYTAFLGTEGSPNFRARVMAARSLDCGQTWSKPVNISEEQRVSQSAAIAIDPRTGAVYVAWRRFQTQTPAQSDAIMISKADSDDFEFSDPVVVSTLVPFDQGMSGVTFRTNSYPALAMDGDGRVYVAWADRMIAGGTARIRMSVSADGRTWSTPSAVDNSAAAGHQIMPALVFAGGRLTVTYYDLRDDSTVGMFTLLNQQWIETRVPLGDLAPPNPNLLNVFNQWIMDAAPPGSLTPLVRRHTIDVRVEQALPGPNPSFGVSQRVTRYAFGNTAPGLPIDQFQFDAPDLPLFKKGTAPFVGDYIDVAAAPAFVLDARGKWIYNLAPSDQIVYHATWADNRDVRPPPINPATGKPDWTLYTPPNSASNNGISKFDGSVLAACVATSTGSRNQNIYTSSISQGLIVSALNNTKPLSTSLQRSFPVTVQNTTSAVAAYRLQIANQPAGGKASFLQFAVAGLPLPLTQVDVLIAPKSTISRTVFVTSTNAHAQVTVTATQITAPAGQPVANGLTGLVLLNPDIENPDIENPDIENTNPNNPSVLAAEVLNPDIENPDIENTAIPNPDIENPDIENPDIENINVMNPDIENPNVSNPDIENPDIENPDIENPAVSSGDLVNGATADAQWIITNRGNTSASYNTKLFATLPAAFKSQLVLYKTYATPVAQGCSLKLQTQNVVIANIPAPVFTSLDALFSQDATDPSLANTSMTLGPGQSAKIALRVVNPNRYSGPQLCMGGQTTGCVDLKAAVAPVIIAQAANTGSTVPSGTSTLFFIPPITLPAGTLNVSYSNQLQVFGGTAPYTWATTGGALPPGLNLNASTGQVSGTPTLAGTFNFTVRATDSSVPPQVATRNLTLTINAPPTTVLAVLTQPSNANTGQSLTPAVQVKVQTVAAVPVPNVNVTLAIGNNPGGATLGGTTTVPTDATGIATFSNLTLSRAGTGYTLVASAAGVASMTSAPFTITTLAGSINTVAGANWPYGGVDGAPATSLPLGPTQGLSLDAAGNLYVADVGDSVLFTISLSGTFQRIAGTGSAGFSGDGGPARQAMLNAPGGVVVDPQGNIYISEFGNARIRKVNVAGVITTVAGNGAFAFSGDGGPATSASLNLPQHLALDAAGNLYVADSGNNRVRMITPAGVIMTVAGNGTAGYSGDGGQAKLAALDFPTGVAVDAAGNLYIADYNNNRVRKVTPAGIISTFAGSGIVPGIWGEGGPATNAALSGPSDVSLDSSGNLYISLDGDEAIRVVNPAGIITTIVSGFGFSGDGGPASSARLDSPEGVLAAGGSIYINDFSNKRVRKITSGIINTIAGNGVFRYGGDGGPAISAFMNRPWGLALDGAGAIYFADTANSRIRAIAPNGTINTIAGIGVLGFAGDGGQAAAATIGSPSFVFVDPAGNKYFSDNNNVRVRKINPAGIITTAVGSGNYAYSGDGGLATNASIEVPRGMAMDAAGNLYLAEAGNSIIRKITPAGIISTFAGTPQAPGYSGDGGPALNAQLNSPEGLAIDAAGNLYVADFGNQVVRKITPGGVITTYAGNGAAGYSGDGGPAASASLQNPEGLAVDAASNLFIADSGNRRVRRVDATGRITTSVGNGSFGNSGDGGPATAAALGSPFDVKVDAAGNLYITDRGFDRIRKVVPPLQ
jgi:sugar lactone lactonase YvrE